MEQSFYEKVRQLSQDIPAAYRKKQFKKIESELKKLIDIAEDIEQRCDVLGMLAQHYQFTRNLPLAEEMLRKRVNLSPESVDAWLNLAEHFHYDDENLLLAAEYVEIALQKALVSDEFVRQILGVRLRIALVLENYNIVNDSLENLVNYKPTKRGLDVAYENDFIERIPVHLVNEEFLNQYKELLK